MSEKPLSRQRLWQIKCKELGLCVTCGKPLNLYKTHCDIHNIAARNRTRKYYRLAVGIPVDSPIKLTKPRLDQE